jgi:hypothetical protein
MPERTWSVKDERKYEHVKQSERERGRSFKSAKEIAARTVNKQRRTEGRAKSKESKATGNPHTILEERSVPELRRIASNLEIPPGRSKMKKRELVGAIRSAR